MTEMYHTNKIIKFRQITNLPERVYAVPERVYAVPERVYAVPERKDKMAILPESHRIYRHAGNWSLRRPGMRHSRHPRNQIP